MAGLALLMLTILLHTSRTTSARACGPFYTVNPKRTAHPRACARKGVPLLVQGLACLKRRCACMYAGHALGSMLHQGSKARAHCQQVCDKATARRKATSLLGNSCI